MCCSTHSTGVASDRFRKESVNCFILSNDSFYATNSAINEIAGNDSITLCRKRWRPGESDDSRCDCNSEIVRRSIGNYNGLKQHTKLESNLNHTYCPVMYVL